MGLLMRFLFQQIIGQLKSLQIVASLTAERDGELRKAALNTLAAGYKILGMWETEVTFGFSYVLLRDCFYHNLAIYLFITKKQGATL